MWDKKQASLALVTMVVVCGAVSAAKQLNMAPDAVDDLYQGCRDEVMERLIHSEVLGKELSGNPGLKAAWSDKCSTLLPGGVKEHTAALLAYGNGIAFRKAFNDEVETTGANASTYERDFHFKSLHFLLTDAMRLVKPAACRNVYRVSSGDYAAEMGAGVRFGRFTTAHTDLSVKEDVEGGVYFNITTCFFVSLEGFCGLQEDVAILSPAEEFTVVDVKQVDDYQEIVLKHSKLEALHNCYGFSRATMAPVGKGAAAGVPRGLVLALVTLLLFSLNC
ncbi:GPI-linked NAD(P)(+)--arginine ADP-ribosyltransferase 1 [Nerophis lumbriciformis]|uniref:GPI-linked NAD(P)(+)--arginine ADP-ribosyltransferase 1 n=1 Tax=Nerophis lumbriciformis TaxID=546530 RepID=UPI002ADFCBFD|nr:GPI-linked NAD(P)(+)--arginine ADP-ribosyltransferase 1-like [Nerophis lumbriciformis]XP_061839992.1 GPI-linked NAD(P)(+)--arginine ADP-ribosyltransferase 1-like [Nerophis lumbriciformis]